MPAFHFLCLKGAGAGRNDELQGTAAAAALLCDKQCVQVEVLTALHLIACSLQKG